MPCSPGSALEKGQLIDLSMLDSGLFFMFPDGFQNHALLDEDAIPGGMLIDILV